LVFRNAKKQTVGSNLRSPRFFLKTFV
jgi:hypothetical protein